MVTSRSNQASHSVGRNVTAVDGIKTTSDIHSKNFAMNSQQRHDNPSKNTSKPNSSQRLTELFSQALSSSANSSHHSRQTSGTSSNDNSKYSQENSTLSGSNVIMGFEGENVKSTTKGLKGSSVSSLADSRKRIAQALGRNNAS